MGKIKKPQSIFTNDNNPSLTFLDFKVFTASVLIIGLLILIIK